MRAPELDDSEILMGAEEVRQERAAIAEYDGLLSRAEAEKLGALESEHYKLSCQTRFACALQTIEFRRDYLALVEKRDGQEHAEKLRAMIQRHWKERRERQAKIPN